MSKLVRVNVEYSYYVEGNVTDEQAMEIAGKVELTEWDSAYSDMEVEEG